MLSPIQALTATDGQVPAGMERMYGTKSSGTAYEVTIDNWTITGATVY